MNITNTATTARIANTGAKRIPAALGLGVLLVMAMLWPAGDGPQAAAPGVPSLAPMLEEVTPAVVNISVSRERASRSTRFFFNGREYNWNMRDLPGELSRFLPPPQLDRRGAAGVIVDADEGYVITNHHVVEGADTITVQLNDDRSFDAELLGSDPGTDIALLRIEADDLMDLDFADMETVRVGDYVVAIGNPFGVGQTVTSGIVSALGRSTSRRDGFEDYIQTDAPINVGNSGGALVDLEGRLIGINTVIISGSGGGSNGVGFAVPADMVRSVMGHLERDGEVRRGMLGVTIISLTPDVAEALQIDGVDAGAVVTSVEPGSAAEEAGLEAGDVIVAMDDTAVTGSNELRNLVGLSRQGDEVELGLYRDGDRMSLDAVIGGPDGGSRLRPRDGTGPRAAVNRLRGVTLRPVTPADRAGSDSGVLALRVPQRSPAYLNGLREGDVIIAVGRRAVEDVEELEDALEEAGGNAALRLLRRGRGMLLFLN